MDDYTLQQELEALAGNAYNPDIPTSSKSEPISATAQRWQTLFHLSADEAAANIVNHRNDLTRTRISDDHWQTIRGEKEGQGYDREAYEFELEMQRKKAALPNLLPTSDAPAAGQASLTYLVELDGPLDSAEKVRQVGEMSEVPRTVKGQSLEDGREVLLCCIDEQGKKSLLQWVAKEATGFEPTILVNPKSLQ